MAQTMAARLLAAAGDVRLLNRLRNEADLALGRLDLGRLTAVLADAYGERVALRCNENVPGLPATREWTYAALEHAVARLAAAHRAMGTQPGQRVMVATANRLDVVLHVIALRRVGAAAVLANARWQRGEFEAVVEGSGAPAIVADGETIERLGAGGVGGAVWRPTGGEAHGNSLAAWLAAHPNEALAPARGPDLPREVCVLLATSGTTGRPKLAALTSEGLLAGPGLFRSAPVGRTRRPRAGRDAVLAALPLTHVMGLVTALSALCAGVPLWFEEKFVATRILERIERDQPNVFVGVPTMYADLESAGADQRDLSSVQAWVSAADVMPEDRARRFQRYGAAARVAGRSVGTATFVDVYGMVELSGAAAVRIYPPSPARRRELPVVGFALPGVELRAVDAEGNKLRAGRVGALQIRGRGVLRGYEGTAGASAGAAGVRGAVDAEGWFSTGDVARVGPGPLFAFAGRGRDRLKVGGFSVFPAEVETALRAHPNVAEVAVVGVPDARTGERLVALVVPRKTPWDREEFLAWAGGQVAGYRRPQEVLSVAELPRGAHGKIDRAGATRQAVEALGGKT